MITLNLADTILEAKKDEEFMYASAFGALSGTTFRIETLLEIYADDKSPLATCLRETISEAKQRMLNAN